MSDIIYLIIESFIFTLALSSDTFIASFSYGVNKIKIPFISGIVINLICCGILTISLFFGYFFRDYISDTLVSVICFIILAGLGTIKLFDSSIKTIIRRNNNLHKEVKFHLFNLKFILNIYADPECADCDESKQLSISEAATLAMALSIDGLAAGFGAALGNLNYIAVITTSFLLGVIAVYSGSKLGKRISSTIKFDMSWISGALLIFLAVMKLII